MNGSRGIKTSLEQLAAGLERADRAAAVATLRRGLAAKSNRVVQMAADLAAKLQADELVADLCTAFERFTGKGMPADKACSAKTAIVQALRQCGRNRPEVFLFGMKCYWPERPYADRRDEAAALRIASVVAHAELGSPSDLEPLVDLLLDPVSEVRQAAVRGLVALGGQQAALVLRLKALSGDANPSVLDECFTGLLEVDGDRYLSFVADFMESADDRIRVAAALAIGECGHSRALDTLVSRWQRSTDSDFNRDLLVAIAILRNEEAMRFLLSLIESGGRCATDALLVLAAYRSNPEVLRRVHEAVEKANTPELRRLFAAKFGKPQGA
jgi:HEAT repeat protein